MPLTKLITQGPYMSRLSMRKISEILRLRFELKQSYRDIARGQNIGVTTVAEYLARAKAAGLTWPLPPDITEQALYERLFLPSQASSKKRTQPDWDYIYQELRKKGMTLQLLWREYRATHPDGMCCSNFCHYYGDYVKTLNPVMRQIHKAGEKTFVDYAGMKMPWIDVKTGEIFEAEIFVGCLGASQYIYVEASASQQLPDWVDSHIHMFEFFGGVSEILVPDNLLSAVTKAHRYDPDINANYQHFAEHYGVAIVPARVRMPKDKAKVENAVGIVERQILAALRHHTFTSLGEMNEAIKKALIVLNQKSFQKMPFSRQHLFETVDKPALKPLPPTRYQLAEWKQAKVHWDYHVALDNHYYSVPYIYIGKPIEIRATHKMVECYYEQTQIALHTRSSKKYQFTTDPAHMPKAHQEHQQFSEARLKNWAHSIGEKTLLFIEHLISQRPFPQQAFRACLGLLRLGKQYGPTRLEKACAKGLSIGATRYQQIELLLKNKLEEVDTTDTSSSSPTHTNIRGPHYYH